MQERVFMDAVMNDELSLAPERFREAMSRVGSAVHIVTTGGQAGSAGVTANAVTSVTAEPPTMLFCLNKTSRAAPLLIQNGVFCINTLASAHQELSDISPGAPNMRLKNVLPPPTGASSSPGAPVLTTALVAFDCRLIEAKEMSTHLILFGRVEAIEVAPKTEALLYLHRGISASLSVCSRDKSKRLFAREEFNASREDLERGLARAAAARPRTATHRPAQPDLRVGTDLFVEQCGLGKKPRPTVPRLDQRRDIGPTRQRDREIGIGVIKGETIKATLKLVFARENDATIGFDRHGEAHFDAAQRAIDANAAGAQANGPRSAVGALVRLVIGAGFGIAVEVRHPSLQIAALCGFRESLTEAS